MDNVGSTHHIETNLTSFPTLLHAKHEHVIYPHTIGKKFLNYYQSRLRRVMAVIAIRKRGKTLDFIFIW